MTDTDQPKCTGRAGFCPVHQYHCHAPGEPVTVSVHGDRHLSPEARDALDALIEVATGQMRDAPTSVGTTGASPNETGGSVGTGPDLADWNSPEDASYDGSAPADSDPARDGLRQRYAAAMWRAAEHTIIAEWICCEPLNPKHDLCAKGYAALAMIRALIVDDPEAWRPAVLTDAVLAVRDAEMGRLTALVTAQREVIERQAREALAVVTEPGTPRVRRDVTREQVDATQARLRSLYRQGRPE